VLFSQLAYKRDTDISFDWDRMLDFRGNSGPYIQYTHARIRSVIRKYGKMPGAIRVPENLQLPEEILMIKKLSMYPEVLQKSAEDNEPYYISSFLLDICGNFNTYYQKYRSPEDRILSSDSELAESRVLLIMCAAVVLKSGLGLLGIKAPEMM
jgi:arginyl-tRNA synthetase